jgi:hypothetical protein
MWILYFFPLLEEVGVLHHLIFNKKIHDPELQLFSFPSSLDQVLAWSNGLDDCVFVLYFIFYA